MIENTVPHFHNYHSTTVEITMKPRKTVISKLFREADNIHRLP